MDCATFQPGSELNSGSQLCVEQSVCYDTHKSTLLSLRVRCSWKNCRSRWWWGPGYSSTHWRVDFLEYFSSYLMSRWLKWFQIFPTLHILSPEDNVLRLWESKQVLPPFLKQDSVFWKSQVYQCFWNCFDHGRGPAKETQSPLRVHASPQLVLCDSSAWMRYKSLN